MSAPALKRRRCRDQLPPRRPGLRHWTGERGPHGRCRGSRVGRWAEAGRIRTLLDVPSGPRAGEVAWVRRAGEVAGASRRYVRQPDGVGRSRRSAGASGRASVEPGGVPIGPKADQGWLNSGGGAGLDRGDGQQDRAPRDVAQGGGGCLPDEGQRRASGRRRGGPAAPIRHEPAIGPHLAGMASAGGRGARSLVRHDSETLPIAGVVVPSTSCLRRAADRPTPRSRTPMAPVAVRAVGFTWNHANSPGASRSDRKQAGRFTWNRPRPLSSGRAGRRGPGRPRGPGAG